MLRKYHNHTASSKKMCICFNSVFQQGRCNCVTHCLTPKIAFPILENLGLSLDKRHLVQTLVNRPVQMVPL